VAAWGISLCSYSLEGSKPGTRLKFVLQNRLQATIARRADAQDDCFRAPFRILAEEKRRAARAVETAAAVEIDKGGLRRFFLDDFHELLGKASAKNAAAFPQLPQRRRRLTTPKKPGK
jgi:hypothetical protein